MNSPIRVRHLEHVKDIRGVGPEMQSLFMQYLDTFPPVPPTADELHLERAARHAGEVAQEATLEKAQDGEREEALVRGSERTMRSIRSVPAAQF